MPTVVIVRSGETDYDSEHRVQGVLDLPLTAHGVSQVRELAAKLTPMCLEVVYCGPSEQARQTARILAEELGCELRVLAELANLNQGLWQGLRVEEIRRKYPRLFKQWRDRPDVVCPPSGETSDEAVARIHRALARPLRRKHRFAIVASEPLATILVCELQHRPVDFSRLYSENGSAVPFQVIECTGD
ncbi:MAG: histidine phosphatase family protein [Planctomycetota bacterium]|nr:MAG: histidine phosphatase family protein [Planctomycetota bacterium]